MVRQSLRRPQSAGELDAGHLDALGRHEQTPVMVDRDHPGQMVLPGGAAAGLALQGLLHEQLGEASQVQYTITGAWDQPLIEPVLKGGGDG